jgi:lipid-A-disaccharide synthase
LWVIFQPFYIHNFLTHFKYLGINTLNLQLKKMMIVAGEVSGDHHAALMLAELKKMAPISSFGVGGDELKAQGMEILYHTKEMAFLGIAEVLKHLPFIKKAHTHLLEKALAERPDAVILIDYPGFNLRLAKSIKKMNIPVIYYITPQVWAWGKRRIKKIKKYIDKLLVIFPFEKDFYAAYDIDSEYVGHPIVDKQFDVAQKPGKDRKLTNIIGLLPGSRKQEIENLLPKMIETAHILYANNHIKKAVIIKVKNIELSEYEKYIGAEHHFISIIEKPISEVVPQLDAALIASGTATLEAGYLGLPMIIVYKVSQLTYFMGKLLVKLPYIGLVNIVAQKELAIEMIQNKFNPKMAAKEMEDLLIPEKNNLVRQELTLIRDKLGSKGASQRAANSIYTFLNKE